mgnify:CR=1 FL=1
MELRKNYLINSGEDNHGIWNYSISVFSRTNWWAKWWCGKLIEDKLRLAKLNPFRFKRIQGYKLFLFRIRFEDERKEKRVVYLVDKPKVKVLCILDRSSEYKQLRKFLKRHDYLWF